jgi:hypothetical protein
MNTSARVSDWQSSGNCCFDSRCVCCRANSFSSDFRLTLSLIAASF